MSDSEKENKNFIKSIALFTGPVIGLLAGIFLNSNGWSFEAQAVGAVTSFMCYMVGL